MITDTSTGPGTVSAAKSIASGIHRVAQLTPPSLALVTLGLALFDWGDELAGAGSFFPGGPLDEVAHVLTTVLILWALGPRACQRLLVPALLASVAIDLDHIPGELGANWLTAGTPRPYTHSLLTIALVLGAALLVRRRRYVLVGVALGLASHFFRDLAEPGSGVALLWPWTDHAFSLAHSTYIVVMAIVVLIDALRLLARRRVRARSGDETEVEPTPAGREAPAPKP
jgi:inner membrane protein